MTQTTSRIASAALAVGLIAALAGCTDGVTDDTTPSDVPPPPANSDTPSSDAPADGDAPATDGTVTMEQAGQIATDAYGGTIKSIEDDNYQGEPAWEVELRDSSEGRVEIKVSKATGEILHLDHED